MNIQPETAIYQISEDHEDTKRDIKLHILPNGDDNRLKLTFNGEDKIYLTDAEGMILLLKLCHFYGMTKRDEKK